MPTVELSGKVPGKGVPVGLRWHYPTARATSSAPSRGPRAGISARVAWKAAFLKVKEKSEQEKEQSALKEKALLARIAELEGRGGAGAPGPGI